MVEMLQSGEVWDTIKPKLLTASGGLRPQTPYSQRFYSGSAPLLPSPPLSCSVYLAKVGIKVNTFSSCFISAACFSIFIAVPKFSNFFLHFPEVMNIRIIYGFADIRKHSRRQDNRHGNEMDAAVIQLYGVFH